MTGYVPRWFKAHELVSKSVFEALGNMVFEYYDDRILQTLDSLRMFFGAPITVNSWEWGGDRVASGYRGPDCEVGGDTSMHRIWRAIDCIIEGVSGTEARDVIMNHQYLFPFITRIEDNVSHLHFDNKNINHNGIFLFQP